eukprot:1490343-Prorocentrum_lima.AAC.1
MSEFLIGTPERQRKGRGDEAQLGARDLDVDTETLLAQQSYMQRQAAAAAAQAQAAAAPATQPLTQPATQQHQQQQPQQPQTQPATQQHQPVQAAHDTEMQEEASPVTEAEKRSASRSRSPTVAGTEVASQASGTSRAAKSQR